MSETNDFTNSLVTELGLEMTQRGIKKLTLEYEGSGDSQDTFDVTLNEFVKEEMTYGADLEASDTIVGKLEKIVDAEHGGYENDAGGSGWMVISVVAGAVTVNWEHNDRYENSEPDNDASLDETFKESISEIIQPVARSCCITYVGGGDSMDGFEYAFADENEKPVNVNDRELIKKMDDELDTMICDSAVAGFWNNEGGHGEIFIDSQNLDNSYWNHSNYFEEIETSLHEFEVQLP